MTDKNFDGPFERTELKAHCTRHDVPVADCPDCLEAYYSELDERYTRGDFSLKNAGPPLHGQAAQESGRAMLMWATNTDNIKDAMAVALGRPKKDSTPTKTVKAVMPEPMANQMHHLARLRKVSAAQLVRDAVAEYLAKDENSRRLALA